MKIITNSTIGYSGRLGNQLFQFASLLGIAFKTGRFPVFSEKNLDPVIEYFHDGKERMVKFELPGIFPKISTAKVDLFKLQARTITESSFTYDPKILEWCNKDININLAGWFQSPLYFHEYRDDIIGILSIDQKKEGRNRPLVSIHVRRGDYLGLSHLHPPLSMDYYAKAISHFHGCHFKIFSDDIEWCQNNFPDEAHGFYFSNNTNEKDDLFDMSLCDHHIIANSTFSWWSAYLCQNPDKHVVAPSTWFGRGYSEKDPREILSIASKII